MTISVATFYRFVPLDGLLLLQSRLRERCQALGLKGTVLLAAEGINATLCGDRPALESLLADLAADARFDQLQPRWSETGQMPFGKLRVRLKREIVTLGRPDLHPADKTGHHVPPADWDALLADPETLVIDTRNRYEVSLGRFRGAISPDTERFRDFPTWVAQHLDPQRHRRVAMYCTGGIRCEKASAWMLAQGFPEVYQLQGGILRYLEEVAPQQSHWEGECFVFDERVSLTHGNRDGEHSLCLGCGEPLQPGDEQDARFEAGVSCPRCHHRVTPKRRKRLLDKRRNTP
ncbi:MAG: rhodanese-related sulfurtransferase [Ectothiorhodospiraceae bacterium]|nr:rhodanese-related sulfurtransferase [Ectothiorhodospiraceae bacterium]MCH8505261.1 rhodanese-related sulfurtransferase [Ectothiorhodospiraceae bacterium]